jgi:RNA polymerase sigma-70 factor (ECF subfamily)
MADADRSAWTALLDRMATGDANACVALYDRSAPTVFSLISHLVGDRQAAEAALQELFVDLMHRTARGEHRDCDAVAWVLSVARTTAIARLRAAANAAAMSYAADDRPSVATPMLDGLDDEQRAIVRMIYFGGLTAREAAARLRRPVQHVIQQLHSALSRLHAELSRSPSRKTQSGRYRAATAQGSSPSPASCVRRE